MRKCLSTSNHIVQAVARHTVIITLLVVAADYETDEHSHSMAIQVENWCQVKERLLY